MCIRDRATPPRWTPRQARRGRVRWSGVRPRTPAGNGSGKGGVRETAEESTLCLEDLLRRKIPPIWKRQEARGD
eukprot:1474140-Alexandrium_andersonii.AAC.1